MSELVQNILDDLKRRLMDKFSHEIVKIVLFGSQARGDARSDSDVDVLVITKSHDWRLGDQVGEVAYDAGLESGIYVSVKVISQKHYEYLRKIHAPFIQNIEKEGVLVS